MAVFRGVHFNAMGFLDRLMDMLTRRGTKLVASGHAPADTAPKPAPTSSPQNSKPTTEQTHPPPNRQPPRHPPRLNPPQTTDFNSPATHRTAPPQADTSAHSAVSVSVPIDWDSN